MNGDGGRGWWWGRGMGCRGLLTQWVSLAVLVGHCEHAHHLVAILPQAAVHLLAKQALANDGQTQLVLVVMLEREVGGGGTHTQSAE